VLFENLPAQFNHHFTFAGQHGSRGDGDCLSSAGEKVAVESNGRYYMRRAALEAAAARQAVTPEAAMRRQALAENFARKARELCA
jgi:hypothetical protein